MQKRMPCEHRGTPGEERGVKMEAKIGVGLPQAKQDRGFQKPEEVKEDSLSSFWKKCSSDKTLILDF